MHPSAGHHSVSFQRRGVRNLWLALTRRRWKRSPARPGTPDELRGGGGMKDQPKLSFSLRCEAGCRLCCRDRTQHTLSVRSFLPPLFCSCRQLPARGTLRHGIRGQTMWRCVQARCGTVTRAAARIPHPALRLPAAWQSVRQLAGILHASPRFRRLENTAREDPQAPAHPRMLAPFHPQGVCARN